MNLTAADYTGGYGNTSINVTVGAPQSVSYSSHTTTVEPLENASANPINVNLQYFNSRVSTKPLYHAWVDFSQNIETYNGTLNAFNGGEFAFAPGFYMGSTADYTIGTVYVNMTYGAHTQLVTCL